MLRLLNPTSSTHESITDHIIANEEELSIPALIARKASGCCLSEPQIERLVRSIADESLDNTQLGALLMALFIRSMNIKETVALTRCMRDSGSVLSWPVGWVVGDKHSTGGVGDKVSLPLTPALAVCGLKVPMISGRGLTHTGGTLDKLESIPGFNANLTENELHDALATLGCVISGQTRSLAPADKRMYAARDVTGTVPSVPLIVSSILSKKAAESLDALVLDVKLGEGGFIKKVGDADELASVMVETMNAMGTKTTVVVTSMDYPLGRSIGNALEVREALQCLSGNGPPDLEELVVTLGGELLCSSGLVGSSDVGLDAIRCALKNGTALEKFKEMLQIQGVTVEVASRLCSIDEDLDEVLPAAQYKTPLVAEKSGTIVGQKALTLGEVSCSLGAGRAKKDDPIDYGVGITLKKVVGERLEVGEEWAILHHSSKIVAPELLNKAKCALVLDSSITPFVMPSRIMKIVK